MRMHGIAADSVVINANLMNIRYSNNGTRKEKHKHENALKI